MKKYTFLEATECNMCGNPTPKNKIIGVRMNRSQGFRPLKNTGISLTILKCRSCHLIYSDPLPIPNDIHDHYGIPPEDYWADWYFEPAPDYFKFQIAKAKELMKSQGDLRALDIGSGIGKCMIALKENGFDAYGLEPSEPFRKMAITKMGIDPIRIEHKMIEDVDYPENHFDFVTFGAVLEHLYNPSENLKKVNKWLKPGGIVHAEIPSSDWLIPRFYNFFYRLIGSSFTSNLSPMHEPFHLFEFSLKSFEEFAGKNNFEIAFYYRTPGKVYYFPQFTHNIMKKIMIKTGTGMQLCVFMRKLKSN
jgi:SAM-dependent methyltransferase